MQTERSVEDSPPWRGGSSPNSSLFFSFFFSSSGFLSHLAILTHAAVGCATPDPLSCSPDRYPRTFSTERLSCGAEVCLLNPL